MIATTDFTPFIGTVGGGFFLGLTIGWAIKQVIKVAALIIGLFIAALAYLEYQRILNIDWNRIEIAFQNGFVWAANAITNISNNIGAHHSISHVGIPLVSSASAGLILGLAKG